ncbi:MAG: MotA/TolQ/ExbB proton channel family protein, partial [Gammaproteobacteria bacterium]|nr:MotA/TolQ/ExbB proton channel family protein [Gammaproteobacteria bacterium]
ILMLWAMSLMAYKAVETAREKSVLQLDLIPLNQGTSILPEDTREYSRPIQALPEEQHGYLLPRTLLTALHRFRSTRNIQDVSHAVRAICDSESERLDSELSMIRYIAWAIPSIGFLGTVRGIGQALGQAHKAVEGDITGVTQSLGVAFNSTFVALLISILIMFLLHQLQLAQERLALDAEEYCDVRLVRHLQT